MIKYQIHHQKISNKKTIDILLIVIILMNCKYEMQMYRKSIVGWYFMLKSILIFMI